MEHLLYQLSKRMNLPKFSTYISMSSSVAVKTERKGNDYKGKRERSRSQKEETNERKL